MKNFILIYIFISISFLSCSTENKVNKVFELYTTKSDLVFLRLDTREGYIWMIEGSIDSSLTENEQILIQGHPMSFDNDPFIGRFELFPTENIYNFMMIDKKLGNVFQIQYLPSDSREASIKNGKGEGIVNWYNLDEKHRKQVYIDGEIFRKL